MSEEDKELISVAGFARAVQVSRQAVEKRITLGRLPVIRIKNRNFVLLEEAKAAWYDRDESKVRSKKIKKEPVIVGDDGDIIPPYSESKARRMYYEAEMMNIKHKLAMGEFVLKDDVEREVFEIGSIFRDKILTVPKQISRELSHLFTVEEMNLLKQGLKESIVNNLNGVANELERQVQQKQNKESGES